MLFSELAKRVAEKYPEVKTAYPMDCELSNVELYDPSGAVPPVDSLSIYTARQISQDMTLPLCFVCAGTPDQAAHDKIAYSDSNYIIIPQVSVVDVVYYIMSLFGDSFKQRIFQRHRLTAAGHRHFRQGAGLFQAVQGQPPALDPQHRGRLSG